MIGVTIGIGEEWAALARVTAARMEQKTGIHCHVIQVDDYRCAHPSWLKCHIHRIFPQADSFLVFDADLLPFSAWDPAALFEAMGRPFMAVPEPNSNDQLLAECARWKLGFPDTYLNGGLLIFGREHGFVWDRVWNMHPHGGSWLEQTALNRALVDEAVEVCRLPRHFNLLAQEGRIKSIYSRSTLRQAVNVHTCALRDPQTILEVHQSLLDYQATGKAGATRIHLLHHLRHQFGPGSTGAEIGVFAGDFSRHIIRILQPSTLSLVDLFQGRVTSGDVNGQNMRTIDMAVRKVELEASFQGTARVIAMDSLQWLSEQRWQSHDWIYLDTTHDYERTAAELRAAWPLLRPGGVLAGHDFSSAFPGVVRAVREFAAEIGRPYRVYDGDLLPSFAISA